MVNSDEIEMQKEAAAAYRPIEQLIPDHWTEVTVQANGIAQHYYRTGGGKRPLVLLHGFMESSLYWLRVAQALEADFDCLMVDARGHGLSAWPGSGFSPAILAADVLALLEELGIEKPVVVGHSNGAVVAVLLAAAYPNFIEAVILEDPPLKKMPPMAWSEDGDIPVWFQPIYQQLQSLKSMSHAERLATTLTSWPPLGWQLPPGEPLWPEADFVGWIEAQARLNLAIFRAAMTEWLLDDYWQQLPTIQCPTLLLVAHNGMNDNSLAQQLATDWPQGQLTRIANAGHTISHGRSFSTYVSTIQSFLGLTIK